MGLITETNRVFSKKKKKFSQEEIWLWSLTKCSIGPTERAWFSFKTEKNITVVLAGILVHSTMLWPQGIQH